VCVIVCVFVCSCVFVCVFVTLGLVFVSLCWFVYIVVCVCV